MLKICQSTQTKKISFKKAHVNENNSYNKPFTIQLEQIFRCSLKTTAYQNQTLFSVKLQALLSLNAQKTQDGSWFYCMQIQEMPLRALPEAVVYRGQAQVDGGEVISRHRNKETRMLLINTVAFS